MSDQWTTPWFPMSVQPVREGVYEVNACDYESFSRWANGQWHLTSDNPQCAAGYMSRSIVCYTCPKMQWRGLTKEAK